MSRNKELLSKLGLRQDGRRANELRRIRCKLGVFTQPDGSAYIEQGLTKVLAAVYGPHQAKGNRGKTNQHDNCVINTQFSMAVFSTNERKKRPRGDRKSTELSMQLEQALSAVIRTELYPWSQIDVYVEVLHADGGVYSACVNAATLALVDAGIPIKEYVVACTASLANNDVPMLDVSHQEEVIGGPTLTVAALPMSGNCNVKVESVSLLSRDTMMDWSAKHQDQPILKTGNIVFMEMSRRFHMDHLQKVLDKALEGCRDIKNILDEAVKIHIKEMGSSTGWAGATS